MFDGINLQSSSYSIFIFLCILFFYTNTLLIKILLISLVSFSYLNYKSKAFLGDSGSFDSFCNKLYIHKIIQFWIYKLFR